MSTQQSGIQNIQRAAAAAFHEHWVLFLVEGVVLLVLGATAVVLPPIAMVMTPTAPFPRISRYIPEYTARRYSR